jgi:hypothetical protein
VKLVQLLVVLADNALVEVDMLGGEGDEGKSKDNWCHVTMDISA